MLAGQLPRSGPFQWQSPWQKLPELSLRALLQVLLLQAWPPQATACARASSQARPRPQQLRKTLTLRLLMSRHPPLGLDDREGAGLSPRSFCHLLP